MGKMGAELQSRVPWWLVKLRRSGLAAFDACGWVVAIALTQATMPLSWAVVPSMT